MTGFPWQLTYLWIAATDDGICRIEFERLQTFETFKSGFDGFTVVERENAVLQNVMHALQRYFRGERLTLEIPVNVEQGTPFQHRVWEIVRRIPYGRTKSYGQIATELGNPRSMRAVGAANGANPVPIVVPCHRVVHADGKLGGYHGGLEIKDALLRLEGVVL